ncbi:hypothetical protein BZL39_B00330 [Zygosaccharomyces parabailii]|nr:hypothetical protein BZL39_B00330 [Zygosaccharomyces parabailii]
MSIPDPSFESPGQSQIDYFDHDLLSTSNSEDGHSIPVRAFRNSSHFGTQITDMENPNLLNNKSNYPDEFLLSKKLSNQRSEHSDAYAPSHITSTNSAGIFRYQLGHKVALKLDSKEQKMIKDSWKMILNGDSASSISGSSEIDSDNHDISFGMSNLHLTGSNKSHTRQDSPHNDKLENATRSNALTSSLFCSQIYWNLLLMAPQMEQLLPTTKHQPMALAGLLTVAINNLDNLEVLADYLIGLGKTHSRILGIGVVHFELMGIAFLKTLQDTFGVHCTDELEQVWSKLYSYLANSILQYGVDPILQVKAENDVLEFPAPNLIEATPKTVTNLKQSVQIDQQSVGTSVPSVDVSSRKERPESTLGSQVQSISTFNQARKSMVSTASATPSTVATTSSSKKSRKFDMSKKPQQYKRPETRKNLTKISTLDFNKDCILM